MRITRINSDHVPEELQGIYDAAWQQRGNVPNMFRTLAHRPRYLQTMTAHFRAIMETGTVSTKLKELLAVRVSQINHCAY